MIFGHVFVGYIIAFLFYSKANIHRFKFNFKFLNIEFSYKLTFWLIAIVGSILPDLDLIYVLLIDKEISHRSLLSHSLVIYVLLVVLLGVYIKFFEKYSSYLFLLQFLLFACIGHIICDVITAPVAIFNPITDQLVDGTLFPFIDYPNWFFGYLASGYLWVELAPIVVGVPLLIKEFRNDRKSFMILLGFTCIILLAAVVTLLPFVLN